jgi:hypothetical protein
LFAFELFVFDVHWIKFAAIKDAKSCASGHEDKSAEEVRKGVFRICSIHSAWGSVGRWGKKTGREKGEGETGKR